MEKAAARSRKIVRLAAGSLGLLIVSSALFFLVTVVPEARTYVKSRETLQRFGLYVYQLRNPGAAETRRKPMPATEIALLSPTGLAEDRAGNLLVGDRGTWFGLASIWRIGEDGIARLVAGSGKRGPVRSGSSALLSDLGNLEGLGVDGAGRIYFADSANHVITRIENNGLLTQIAGSGEPGFAGDGGPATEAFLRRPHDVRLDSEGRTYIADLGNHRIRRVDLNGTIETVAGTGEPGYAGDGGPATAAQLNRPYGISIDQEDRLLIADSLNHLIRRVDQDGTIATIAGSGSRGYSGDGGPALSASFDAPASLDVDATGRIYVGDEHNHAIRVIAPDGTISTLIGDGSAGFSVDGSVASGVTLIDPESVLAREDGSVVVSDGDNGRVITLRPDGRIHTLAGMR